MPSPIVIFAYDRRDHLEQTIESLLRNELSGDSDLIVYSDAPKTADKELGVQDVRAYLSSVSGFKSVRLVCRDVNYGLAKSVISGVSEVLEQFETVIVLEDDMITSPHFLRFMNEALTSYECDHRIASIHGYIFPLKEELATSFFLRGADCWGWATWRRGWRLFNDDGSFLLSELRRKSLLKEFNFNNSYPYTAMLQNQIEGRVDSWAIRWYASVFLADKLTLYPAKSLVNNIGNDSSGTHCGSTAAFDVAVSNEPISVVGFDVTHSNKAYSAYEAHFRSLRSGWINRGLIKMRGFLAERVSRRKN